ncbi:ArnT family glycosyltransferase [Niabella soli]|uniref:Glycosyltransferase RgtA/B/C/D-like domain-containing protein n=1 Tax=Niabella soli DSM 19437 TaxID=929713 RepID=W0F4V0_9BACT|nr:glycosyltransferase family 39 protein [Niabella soli]AHF18037.1 hypothetical protein NIASO_19215 [Niabella soli DSM 19437]
MSESAGSSSVAELNRGSAAPGGAKNEQRILLGFMLAWFVINCIQAAFMGLDGDEAYYWLLSRKLQWSYFDHPPMVALSIRLGESFGHGFLFTRLGTILLSTLTIGLIYKGLPAYLQKLKWFIIVYAATLVLNVYAFITTPDACLFFFAALFFWRYKYFLEKENFGNSLWLVIAITGMFYSKYHGILLVGFVVLSNPRLLLNKYFWLIVALVTLLFLPYLYWQYNHDWATVRFHLVERIAKQYEFSFTTDYLLGQLLIWGPLTSVVFFIVIGKLKIKDRLMRAHVFMFAGTIGFFLISSFKNTVEPHWTLIAGVSYIALFLLLLVNGTERFKTIFFKIAYVNIGLILLARIIFLIPDGPANLIEHFRSFSYAKTWADQVYSTAGKTPVVFASSYALPSLYQYYHPDAQTFGYNDKGYRKTHFNIATDCFLDGQPVLYYTQNDKLLPGSGTTIKNEYNSGRLLPIDRYVCIQPLRIALEHAPETAQPGQTLLLTITLSNKGTAAITPDPKLFIDYAFFIEKYNFINSDQHFIIPHKSLAPGASMRIRIPVTTPEKPGAYRLLFSIVNGFIPGNFASNFYVIKVK